MDARATAGILARLVAFDTVSDRPNRALIEYVAEDLRKIGMVPQILDGGDGKAGLIASIGPPVAGGVVLSGHTDVVPVAGQVWSSDPFSLREAGDRFYGRGTADMKGFIAAVLASLPLFAGRALRRPLHLVLSWDEEVGCLGAPALIQALLETVPQPAAVIVGEPTGMQVADRHRGIATFRTVVRGRGGHSSAPQHGASAIAAAARIVTALEGLASGGYSHTGGAADSPPAHTTVNVGTIQGGAAVNMVPEHCCLTWECRPGSDLTEADVAEAVARLVADEVLPSMRARAPEATIVTERMVSVPALRLEEGSPAAALAMRLTGQDTCRASPFASEAGLFQSAGIPAAVIGPGWPSQAHQPDEFVDRDQLVACLAFLEHLGEWASTYDT